MKTILVTIVAVFLFSAAFSEPLADEPSASVRQTTNAAFDYQRAFKAMSVLTEDDHKLLTGEVNYENPAAKSLALKVDPALSHLHLGSVKPDCDWGLNLKEEGAAAAFPHLAKVRLLAKCALFRARYNWAQGRKQASVKDLRATLALADHVGAKGNNGFVSLVTQYEIEALSLSFIFERLKNAEAAEIFAGISDRIPRHTDNAPKTALLLEREVIVPWVKQYVGSSSSDSAEKKTRVRFLDDLVRGYGRQRTYDAVEETRDHYTKVADLLDLPPDEFEEQYALYIDEVEMARNPCARIVIIDCPAIKRSYYQRRELIDQWLRFKAEVDRYLAVSREDSQVPRRRLPLEDEILGEWVAGEIYFAQPPVDVQQWIKTISFQAGSSIKWTYVSEGKMREGAGRYSFLIGPSPETAGRQLPTLFVAPERYSNPMLSSVCLLKLTDVEIDFDARLHIESIGKVLKAKDENGKPLIFVRRGKKVSSQPADAADS